MIRPLCVFSAALIAIGLSIAHESHADSIVISSGKAGGYYDSVAHRLRFILMRELGTFVEIENSEGSLDNLARLDDDSGPVGIAFTQTDALAHYLHDHPTFADEYVVLTELGAECAFLIAPREGGIDSVADLHDGSGLTVAVGDALSGAAVTYEHMSRIDPRFRKAPAQNIEIIEALLDLKASDKRSKVGAALVVQRPLAISVPVEIVMGNRDLYRFVPIRRSDIRAESQLAGMSGYSFETVTLGFGRDYEMSFETLCTEGLVLAAKGKFDSATLGSATRTILGSRYYIVPRRK